MDFDDTAKVDKTVDAMSHNELIIWRSGQSLFGNASAASQYGNTDVAAKAVPRRCHVCLDQRWRHLASASLSIFTPGTATASIAADATTQSCLHGDSASAINPGGTPPLPAAAAAHQPCGSRPVARMVGATITHGRRQTGNCSMRVTIQSGSSRRTQVGQGVSLVDAAGDLPRQRL